MLRDGDDVMGEANEGCEAADGGAGIEHGNEEMQDYDAPDYAGPEVMSTAPLITIKKP